MKTLVLAVLVLLSTAAAHSQQKLSPAEFQKLAMQQLEQLKADFRDTANTLPGRVTLTPVKDPVHIVVPPYPILQPVVPTRTITVQAHTYGTYQRYTINY